LGRFRLAVFNTQPPHLYRGGVERRIIETTKRLTKDADVTVYSGTKAGFNTPTQIDGINLAPVTSTDRIFPLDNWTFNRNLTKNAAGIQADVYECHNVSAHGLLRKSQKKPFVHTIHGVLADEYLQAKSEGVGSLRGWVANKFMRGLANREAEIAKKADLIVTISQYSIQKILQNYTVPKEKIRLAPNGVDTDKFKPQPVNAELKRGLGVDGKPCVLFVGNLVPRKGLPFLVEAARKVTRQVKDAQFLIVGDGPQKSMLTTQIQNHYLTGHFHFLDNIPDAQLPAIYNSADLFVLPSIQEGQGIVLLEAQACGKPVVAFDVGGVNETVQDGKTGFLVERGNVDEFANALVKLLTDRTLGEKMGLTGRGFMEKNFTWELCAQRMLSVYREALTV
jgi:glycosyltransferase involved in cell wall biosynthesis